MTNQEGCRFTVTISRQVDLPYLLYRPLEYDQQPAWPLVLFLHGRGECGTDLTRVPVHGLPKHIAAGQHFPFVVASPQCPPDSHWPGQLDALEALLDHLITALKINARQVYVTGLSMGGYGTWHLAARCPQRIAAIAPVCGGGLPWLADQLKDVPVWAFHGSRDDVVPLCESRVMVQAVRAAGGTARLTIYRGVGHDSWTQTYANPQLYAWLLSHQR